MPEAAWRAWRSLREEFFGTDIRSSWVTAPAYNRISFAFIRVHLRFRAGTSRRNPFFAVWNRFRAVLDPFSAKNDASGAIFGLPGPKTEDFHHGWTRMNARSAKNSSFRAVWKKNHLLKGLWDEVGITWRPITDAKPISRALRSRPPATYSPNPQPLAPLTRLRIFAIL